MCLTSIGQRNVTSTPVTNTGSGGVNSNKASFQSLRSRFEQTTPGPTTPQTGVRSDRGRPGPPQSVVTNPTTRDQLIEQRERGVQLAPRQTPPTTTTGTGVSGRSGGVTTPSNPPTTTRPDSRTTPNPQITGGGTTTGSPQGTGRVVTVTPTVRPNPPRETPVTSRTTPIQSRNVTEQTTAPVDKLNQRLAAVENRLNLLKRADPETIRRDLPKLAQFYKGLVEDQRQNLPEGATTVDRFHSRIMASINELKLQAQAPPPRTQTAQTPGRDPKAVTQDSLKDLTELGVFAPGSTTSYSLRDKTTLGAKAQQLAGLLGQSFADKMTARYSGKTEVIFNHDPLQNAAVTAATTSTGRLRMDIVSDMIGNAIVRDLATVLVDDNGRLTNKGLGDLTLDLSHPDLITSAPIGTLKNSAEFIRTLSTNAGVREALQNVSAPTDEVAKNLVRATLGLPAGSRVGVAETRRAVLTAMLSELRQGSVGSCFATSVCVGIQKSNPEAMIKDLGEMLSTGKLQKGNVETTVVLNGNSPQMAITIDNSMRAAQANRPDMKAALLAMGIPENQHATKINSAMTGMSQPNPKKILEKLAREQGGTAAEQGYRLTNAQSAFHGASQNVLSRAFEYTVANLSANHTISQSKRQLTDGLFGNYGADASRSMPGFLQRQGIRSGSVEYQAAERAIKTIVGRQFSLHYDPMISATSSDGHSDAGAFQMRHTGDDGRVTEIKTEQQYKAALQSSINNALTRIVVRFPGLQPAINGLPGAMTSIAAESAKAFEIPGSGSVQKPWAMEGGGFAEETLVAYHGLNSKSDLHHFEVSLGGAITGSNSVRSGLQFTEKLIRGMEQLVNRDQSHVVVGAPGHNFNMLPSHPSVKPLLGNLGTNPHQAITNHLNSMRTSEEPNPKIVLCDSNWGSSTGSTCLALAFANGTPTLQKYDPHSNVLSPLPENLREFVNAGSWTATELAT